MREVKPGWWAIQTYRECDCPECERHGHWFSDATTGDPAQAKKWRAGLKDG